MSKTKKTEVVVTANTENIDTTEAKRSYTPRGTTVVGVRTVLLNGKVIGRGRPSDHDKSERRVVYVPRGETYNASVHGSGVKYDPAQHPPLKRLPVGKATASTPTTVEAVSFDAAASATKAPAITAPAEVATVEAVLA
jgi:hypothetical protein